ncbi:hypothetical protein KZP23_01525 [Echinicola marina]|uniref:Nmad3 family putative nucleotide modification protein n=1 Tax=Echinicola marina TaxID=2859768 RepID=UPI001CF6BC61|nr:hypothetical protein [Echinicola marina]UCS93745.1 hypothetical protein KZP23_01525 [Echinicola marina]
MRIVLSRKGFDMQYGGQPSPILPDGTLLSLPIPENKETLTFGGISHEGQSYFDIIQTLNPRTAIDSQSACHLDPDIVKEAIPRLPNWRPLFGQAGAAQGHLAKSGVGKGDLFLFFGTFRQTEMENGFLRYVKKAPDVHLIYGYLEVGEVHDHFESLAADVKYHPHAHERFRKSVNNCIYEASDRLGIQPEYPGAGVLKYHQGLKLTKDGYSKSRWDLPAFFKGIEISYHSEKSFQGEYFQSAAKGQEFVMEANEQVVNWAKGLIQKGR